MVEAYEADYLIVLTEEKGDNKLLVLESQFKKLELKKNVNYFVYKEKKKDLLSSIYEEPSFEVFIAIKFLNA